MRSHYFRDLTSQQTQDCRAVYQFIIEHKQAHDGNSPTIRQIMAACHLNSTSYVKTTLERLEKQGRIYVEPDQTRSISVTGGGWSLNL